MIFLYGDQDTYRNYRQAMEAVGERLCCSLCLGAAEGCHGLLLPGGGDIAPWRYGEEDRGSLPADPERDWAELTLLDRFVRQKKPVLGICRGLQVINVYFGGTLCQDIRGHRAVEGIDRIHYVRTAPEAQALLPETIVNSSHHQSVDRLGGGLAAIQWAPDGTVEALVHHSLPILALQWHPERMGSLRVFEVFRKKTEER